ncbi:zinc ribbon domain-containing protein [Baekduia soli]|uniref:Zinc ribbon domain-containing protein n=1 Tax=Baekduia soli TaxID=496014 RepID=A0A5B8U9I5_9ACTN|nr:zinc ribbon domain-containing protein [Baekduia soli]
MAFYEYQCDRDGAFDITRPIGTAPESVACPLCRGDARRVFSKPMLSSSAPRALVAAIEHAEKSRHEPEIVTSLPRPAHASARRCSP